MKRNNLYFLTIIPLVLFILLLFPLPGICSDKNISLEWDKTFGGSDDDRAYSLIQTTDGGYMVAGYTFSKGAGKGDIWVIKLDGKGNKLWDKTFGGSGDDGAVSLIQTTDGGYTVAGYIWSKSATVNDCWVIKFSEKKINTILLILPALILPALAIIY